MGYGDTHQICGRFFLGDAHNLWGNVNVEMLEKRIVGVSLHTIPAQHSHAVLYANLHEKFVSIRRKNPIRSSSLSSICKSQDTEIGLGSGFRDQLHQSSRTLWKEEPHVVGLGNSMVNSLAVNVVGCLALTKAAWNSLRKQL